MEILNLISQGLCSYNTKHQVPSDIGSHFLPPENLQTQTHLENIKIWTDKNLMQLNTEKSKFMIFNFTEKYQFNTRLSLEGELLEQVSQKSLLGVVLNDKLTWDSNTDFIVRKAYKRMAILHNLFKFGLPVDELVQIYILYIRSLVENSAVVWHSSLKMAEIRAIERVQKVALKIILSENYQSYVHALRVTGLVSLHERRNILCKKFALSCIKNEKTCHMFPKSTSRNVVNTRNPEKFFVQPARTDRLMNSAIPFMQRLLNSI